MAKTIKRESKPKTTTKKNTVVKEEIINKNVISPEIEGGEEPTLVNDKNEVIYNPQEELKNLLNKIESKIPTDFIADDVKEGFDFIKNNVSIPSDLGDDIEKNIEFVEKQMEDLNKIKENIIKNTNSKSNFNFTSFWNGTTNKW